MQQPANMRLSILGEYPRTPKSASTCTLAEAILSSKLPLADRCDSANLRAPHTLFA